MFKFDCTTCKYRPPRKGLKSGYCEKARRYMRSDGFCVWHKHRLQWLMRRYYHLRRIWKEIINVSGRD